MRISKRELPPITIKESTKHLDDLKLPLVNPLPVGLAAAGEALVRYMLFADEQEITCAVSGTSKYTEQFVTSGIRDRQGRSLRDLDLQCRLLKFPCSYLIYSEAFGHLPEPMTAFVRKRMTEILTAVTVPEGYEKLSDSDRKAVVDILHDTKPGFLLEEFVQVILVQGILRLQANAQFRISILRYGLWRPLINPCTPGNTSLILANSSYSLNNSSYATIIELEFTHILKPAQLVKFTQTA